MEQKTYTTRHNARRAGVQAGIPAGRVVITVHKDGDEVRFGFADEEACWRRPKFDPPCRLNFDPGLGAGIG